MEREEIDQKYINQASQLEAEFFRIVNEGKPNQHRVKRVGKTIAEFNQRHAEIWRNHEVELLAKGFIKPTPEPEPVRDPLAEIDEIRAKLKEKGIL
ncbi:hypothetical protein ES703_28926 [subsurface metagenome]